MGMLNFNEIDLAKQKRILFKITLDVALRHLNDAPQEQWVERTTELMTRISNMENTIQIEDAKDLFKKVIGETE